MSDARPSPPSPRAARARRVLRAGAVVAAVLATAAVVAWFALRDAPRRAVERTLARELDADVRLGGLEIEGLGRFVLRDLVVREPRPWPHVEEIRIPALRVEGAVGAIRAARFDALRLDSPTFRVRVPPGPAPPSDEDGARPEVGVLEIRDGTVIAASSRGTFRAGLAATLRDVPAAPEGTLTVTASDDPIAPLVAVALERDDVSDLDRPTGVRLDRPCPGLIVTATVEASGAAGVGIAGACAFRDARGETRPVAFDLRATAAAPEDATGVRDVRVDARVDPGVELRAAARWGDGGPPRWSEADLDVPDLAGALAVAGVLPPDWEVAGAAEVRAERDADGALRVVVDGRLDRAVGSWTGGRVRAESIGLDLDAGLADVAAPREARVRGTVDVGRLDLAGGDLAVPPDLGAWRVALDGIVSFAPGPGYSGTASVVVPGLGPVEARGTVATDADGEIGVDVEIGRDRVDLASAVDLARRVGAAVPADVALRGTARVRVRAGGPADRPAIEVSCTASAVAATVAGGTDVEADTVRLDARGTLDGVGAASLDAGGLRVRAADVAAFRDGRASARVRSRADGTVEIARASVAGAIAPAGWPERDVTVEAAGAFRGDGRFGLDAISVAIAGLARLEGSAARTAPDGAVAGTVRLAEADVAALRAWIENASGPVMPGYALAVAPTFDAAFEVDPAGAWSARGTLGWSGLSASSDDGARVVEGLDGSLAIEASGTTEGRMGRVRATGTTEGFVMLWGRVFADYADLRPALDVSANWTGAGGGPAWQVEGRLTIPDGVEVEAGATAAGADGPAWRAALRVAELAAPFERWVREPLVDSLTFLDRVRAGGGLDLVVEGAPRADGGGSVRGAIAGRAIAVDVGEAASLAGLDVDLPVEFAWSPVEDGGVRVDGPERAGRLAFDRLDVAGIPVRAVETELRIAGDTIGLRRPVEFSVLGGEVSIGSLTAADLSGGARRLEARMEVSGVRLDRLAEAVGLPPLDGSLEAAFPRVTVTPDEMRVDGGGEVRVFGGVVRLGDISGESVLTRYPRITLSAEFDEIDLASITKTFDFGEMTGIVRGHVRDCELFRGVPVRFDASVESVRREGVRRSITVKAIDNLTILGTGGKANVFDRGIHRFLDRYPYEELSVSALLADDVFVLRGGARRGERELFLKGRLPFRLDVVNVLPGQTVSFSTMLERLSQLDLASATTEP